MDGSNSAVCSHLSALLSGLRGAVAFSLALRDTSTEVRRTIFTTTLLLVVFTICVLGTAVDPMLRCLDIRSVLTPRRATQSVWCKSNLSSHLSICPFLSFVVSQTDTAWLDCHMKYSAHLTCNSSLYIFSLHVWILPLPPWIAAAALRRHLALCVCPSSALY